MVRPGPGPVVRQIEYTASHAPQAALLMGLGRERPGPTSLAVYSSFSTDPIPCLKQIPAWAAGAGVRILGPGTWPDSGTPARPSFDGYDTDDRSGKRSEHRTPQPFV